MRFFVACCGDDRQPPNNPLLERTAAAVYLHLGPSAAYAPPRPLIALKLCHGGLVIDVPEWVARAKPAEAVTIEVGFLVSESFRFGSEFDSSLRQWKTLSEPLYRPKLPRRQGYVLTDALTKPKARKELLKYFADVIRLAEKHGTRRTDLGSYFWMRPVIFAPGEFRIGFPWHDYWEDTQHLLGQLECSGDGDIYRGADQGWELTIFASGDRLFIRQGDFDTGEEQQCVACDRRRLARQIPPLRDRCERLLPELRGRLGHDYWTGSQPVVARNGRPAAE